MSRESTSRGLYIDEFLSSEEFDIDFEFDAPQFCDFLRLEFDSESEEIDNWFESSGNYPPSPFSPKIINWKLEPLKQSTSTSSEFKSAQNTTPVIKSSDTGLNRNDKYNGFIYYNQTVKDVPKTKSKSKSKTKTKPFSSNSTLQRPTASLLARQNKPLDIYSLQLLRRCQRSLGKFDDNISSLSENQDPKRSKLEARSLHKVGQVKSDNKRTKLTIPKEPNLRTAARSERHKSKVNLETEKSTKSSSKSSTKHPTNNKAKNEGKQVINGSNSQMIKGIDSARRDDTRKINSQVTESKICSLNPKVMQISSQDPWECPFLYHQNKEELNSAINSDFFRLFNESDASMDTSSKDETFRKPFSQLCLSSSNVHTPVPCVVQTLVA